jgi:hypothetical protein
MIGAKSLPYLPPGYKYRIGLESSLKIVEGMPPSTHPNTYTHTQFLNKF